jgi:hypothetical protein
MDDHLQRQAEAAVLAYMNGLPEAARSSMRFGEIEEGLLKQGFSRRSIFQAFNALRESGRLPGAERQQ